MNLKDFLEDILPIKRKSSADWVLPALAGLGAGVAIGAGLGMLVAPDTGEHTRFRLREGAHRMKERAGELADRARGQVSSTASQIQGRSS